MTWMTESLHQNSVLQNHCRDLGSHLASVTDLSAYSFLQQITQTASQTIAWIGGFNLQVWIHKETSRSCQGPKVKQDRCESSTFWHCWLFVSQGQWMWTGNDMFYYTNWYTQNSYSSYPCIYLRTTSKSSASTSTYPSFFVFLQEQNVKRTYVAINWAIAVARIKFTLLLSV